MSPSSWLRKPKRISERDKEGLRKLKAARVEAVKKGKMGIPKQKWTPEEESALLAGVAKHGAGKWRNILKDPQFQQPLILRSNVDLKDKWRNLGPTLSPPQVKRNRTTAVIKNPLNVMDDSMIEDRHTTLIFEALLAMKDPEGSDAYAIHDFIQRRDEAPIPRNFNRLVGRGLRSLVLLGKLEKTNNGFKIKEHTSLGTKTPSGSATSAETEDDDVHITAHTIADAENKSLRAAKAVRETERVSKLAEETESILLLAEEINEQCSRGEVVYLA